MVEFPAVLGIGSWWLSLIVPLNLGNGDSDRKLGEANERMFTSELDKPFEFHGSPIARASRAVSFPMAAVAEPSVFTVCSDLRRARSISSCAIWLSKWDTVLRGVSMPLATSKPRQSAPACVHVPQVGKLKSHCQLRVSSEYLFESSKLNQPLFSVFDIEHRLSLLCELRRLLDPADSSRFLGQYLHNATVDPINRNCSVI